MSFLRLTVVALLQVGRDGPWLALQFSGPSNGQSQVYCNFVNYKVLIDNAIITLELITGKNIFFFFEYNIQDTFVHRDFRLPQKVLLVF